MSGQPCLSASSQNSITRVGMASFPPLNNTERIARIDLSGLTGPQRENCASLMREPFLVLRTLSPGSDGRGCLPSGHWSGGSASRLQMLKLSNNPFVAQPSLVSSASSLVELHLAHHSSTGYISPDAMAACMTMLTRLRFVHIISDTAAPSPNIE
jgi:hypothetical protein